MEEAQKQRDEEARREEAITEEATHSQEEGVAEKTEPRKVTQKQSLEERLDHHSHDTRRGT